jgi:hypothetical protein
MIDNNLAHINPTREPYLHFYSLDGQILSGPKGECLTDVLNFTGIKIYWNGNKCWYKDGLLHRKDGPAIINSKDMIWFENGIEYFKIKYRDGLTKEACELLFNLMKLKGIGYVSSS